MRVLSPELLAAQRAAVRQEAVVCRVVDAPVEWPRWSWTEVYGSGDPDGAHGIVRLASGPLVRARQAPDGALYSQRIDDPAQSASWSAWTLRKAAGTTAVGAGLALAASDLEDRARLFYVDGADGRTIRCLESTDGLAWTEETVYAEPSPRQVRGLAADMTGGDGHLIYALDLATGDPDEVLVAIERVGGAWTNRVQHGQTRWPTAGIWAAHDPVTGIVYVAVADAEADGARRIALQELDAAANAWGAGTVVASAAAGSGFDLRWPRLRLATAAFPRHTYTYVERLDGAPPRERAMLAVTPRREWLTEVVPWDVESAHGFQLLRTSDGWYLSGAAWAYRAPPESGGTGQVVDCSADVVALEAEEPAPMRAARLTVLLDNASGGYAAAGQAGAKLALREGSQLALGLGLRTANGPETVWQTPWWIDRVAFEDERGVGYLRIECVDAWTYLERLRAPRQLVFATGATIGQVLNRLLWRVTGGTLAETGALATTLPGFTLGPGESYAAAARRLCRLAGVIVRFGTLASAPDGAGLASVVPDAPGFAPGPSGYAYAAAVVATAAQHPIERARYASGGQEFSQVEVFGAGSFVGDALDHDAIRRRWKNVARKVVDRAMDDQAKVDALAERELSAAQTGAVSGWLEAGAHVGLELGDVVDLTDPRAGLSAARRTVVGIRTVFDRRRSTRLWQRVALAGVAD